MIRIKKEERRRRNQTQRPASFSLTHSERLRYSSLRTNLPQPICSNASPEPMFLSVFPSISHPIYITTQFTRTQNTPREGHPARAGHCFFARRLHSALRRAEEEGWMLRWLGAVGWEGRGAALSALYWFKKKNVSVRKILD